MRSRPGYYMHRQARQIEPATRLASRDHQAAPVGLPSKAERCEITPPGSRYPTMGCQWRSLRTLGAGATFDHYGTYAPFLAWRWSSWGLAAC